MRFQQNPLWMRSALAAVFVSPAKPRSREDLGISGAGHHDRPGFSRLLTAICDGRVGAGLAMEASRLARNNRDWHHLIDLCVLTQTLVVDAEGIYDLRLLNDRLLLGLKGDDERI